jgi:glycosyltransferase involved in cell wall biosynthesis
MRVFLGLTEVSGYYTWLEKGFRELGIDAQLVSLYKHPFGYGTERKESGVLTLARLAVTRRVQALERGSGALVRALWLVAVTSSRTLLFLWAVARFDAFIFSCGTTFFRYRELPLLRLLGKRVIHYFHGNDSRPAYIDGFCESSFLPDRRPTDAAYVGYIGEGEPEEETLRRTVAYIRATGARRASVTQIERFADVVISSPSYAHFHTRPFAQRVIIGRPSVPEGAETGRVRRDGGGAVRILHSPSVPEGKGTPKIREAIAALKARGLNIDYVELTGRPNREVLAEIARCDFVIDQLYSDLPIAGFSTEAAAFGKATVIGGYYSEQIEDDLQSRFIPPALFCHPDAIVEAIEKLVVDEKFRNDLGERARAFVHGNWTARQVAARFVRLIDGDIPEDWLFDPARIRYLHGMGLSEKRATKIVAAVVRHGGPQALGLSGKPRLERMFLDFAFPDGAPERRRDLAA